MEFVCIEAKTFEDMRMALELLKKKVETLSQRAFAQATGQMAGQSGSMRHIAYLATNLAIFA